jgi:hypothetical protein
MKSRAVAESSLRMITITGFYGFADVNDASGRENDGKATGRNAKRLNSFELQPIRSHK